MVGERDTAKETRQKARVAGRLFAFALRARYTYTRVAREMIQMSFPVKCVEKQGL